ncbi:MAG TPA: urease accessory protein UreE [Chthoniobacterales bacterium]
MIRVENLLSAAPPNSAPVDAVALPYELRQKPRQRLVLNDGTEIALWLTRGTVLHADDLLQAEDGRLIQVKAACQPVLRVTAPDRLTLTRAAYHLGNRHTPVEIGTDYLRLEADPVLHDLLLRLGARVEEREEPFEPEAGAYGGGHRHGHSSSFAEDHALAQALYHEHSPPDPTSPDHPPRA